MKHFEKKIIIIQVTSLTILISLVVFQLFWLLVVDVFVLGKKFENIQNRDNIYKQHEFILCFFFRFNNVIFKINTELRSNHKNER